MTDTLVKTGDTFVDSQGRTWTVGEPLGQGTWGRSWVVSTGAGRELVLKVAFGPLDFPHDVNVPRDVLAACAEAAREQAKLLKGARLPFLPKLEAELLIESRPALLMHRYNSTLKRRMEAGLSLSDALNAVHQVAAQLRAAGRVHGNLRPSNILINERGEPVLTDLLTPSNWNLLPRMEAASSDRDSFRPPESDAVPGPGWDAWALCQILYQAAMSRGAIDALAPAAGLDKVEIATLKDRAIARLSAEQANMRFRSRLTEKLGAVLNRGLSLQKEPSPPYRFASCTDLLPRLEEITTLLDPRVTDVGRILLGAAAAQAVFQGDQPVAFSISVECSAGVTEHEDLVCGLQLVDLDADAHGRIPVDDASFKVSKHPSGRLRFQFTVPSVPPGRYRIKTAFSVKDSGHEPQVALGEFEVRPQPGYVPPALDIPERGPIQIGEIRPALEAPATEPGLVPSSWEDPPSSGGPSTASDPGAEIIEGFFPKPIAPPTEPDPPLYPVEVEVAPTLVQVEQEIAEQAAVLDMPIPIAMQGAQAYAPSPARPSAAPPPPPMLVPRISIGAPATLGQPPLPPTPAADGMSWAALSDALSGGEDDFAIGADGLLPGTQSEGSDLPFWGDAGIAGKAPSIPGLDQVLELVRRDSYSAFVAAAALSFVLLLAMMALLRAF